MAERAFQVLPNTANAQMPTQRCVSDSGLRSGASLDAWRTFSGPASRASRSEACAHDDLTQKETAHARAERSDRSVRNGRGREGSWSHDAAHREGSGAASRHESPRASQVGSRATRAAVRGASRSQELLSVSGPTSEVLQQKRFAGSTPAGSTKEGGSDAPTPPKVGPTEYVGGLNTQTLRSLDAHGEHIWKDSTSVARSQGGHRIAPAALKQDGDRAQLSARGRGARASGGRRLASGHPAPVRLTDGEAPVAQPGSAPQPELPVAEVARSNRAGGSTSNPNEVSRVHLGIASRLATADDCVAGSASAQPAPRPLFCQKNERMCGAPRSRDEAPRVATVLGRAA